MTKAQIDDANVVTFPGDGQTDGEGPGSQQPQTEARSMLAQPDQDFLDYVEASFSTIDQLMLERSEINDKIAAEKAGLEAKGLNKHAFKAVLAFRKLNEDQQENYDLTNQLLRRAIRAPVQLELLEAQISRTH